MKTHLNALASGLARSAIAVALLAPAAAFAQEAPQTAAESGATEAAQPEIVVTGSRLRRTTDYATASPTVSLGSQLLQQSGTTNLTDFLTGLPALVGSSTSRDNSGDRAGIGTTGLNLLNLRNLGVNRTLVLVDGRRHVSGLEGSQAVDINTIPEDLIDRIDVLTGGASAVYGADGVTGVVNFVLKKNFEGVTARAQAGISKYGDAGNRLIGITAGHNFAGGRGNISIAYEYGGEDRLNSRQRPELSGTDAVSFVRNPNYVAGQPGSYSRIPMKDVRYQWTARGGAVDVDFDGVPDYNGDGRPYNLGTAIPGGYSVGSDDTLVSDYRNDLRPSTNRHVVNLLGHFDVSDKLQLFGEVKYANVKAYSLAQPTFDYYLFVPEDNPYIPAAIKSAIDPANGGVLVTRDNFDLGQRGESIKRETWRTVVGARGDLNESLHYEVSYVFGQTNVTNHFVNDRYTDRFMAAIDAVDDGTGKITCRVNLDPTAAQAITFKPGECVPFNVFGEGKSSQAALDFIHANTTEHSRITQHVVNGFVSGDTRSFFSLPGGPVGFVLGGEYRKESSRFDPDPLEVQGLTFSNVLNPSRGSFDVKEGFAEIDLPVFKDRPFFQTLDFSAAVRLSDYSSIGHTTTWKFDGNWAPVRDIRFRGTISQAVRAPNISELYGASSQTFAFFDDPCIVANRSAGTSSRAANCQAILSQAGLTPAQIASFDDTRSTNIAGTQGGNAGLRAEVARTWTAGVVLTPRFVPGLQVSFDWYDIKLKQAINTVEAQQLAELCVDQPTINNQFCSSIHRASGTGLIDDFTLQPQNVANFRTSGLDVNLNYRFAVKKVGAFELKLIGSYLNKLSTIGTPGAEPTDERGQAYYYSPKYQLYASATYSTGRFAFNYNMSWWDKTLRYTLVQQANNPNYVAPEYKYFKPRAVHNIYASVDVQKNFQFYGGISNLFNQKPDLGSVLYPTEDIGTSFYAGARVKF